jgi:hypothetical protein
MCVNNIAECKCILSIHHNVTEVDYFIEIHNILFILNPQMQIVSNAMHHKRLTNINKTRQDKQTD